MSICIGNGKVAHPSASVSLSFLGTLPRHHWNDGALSFVFFLVPCEDCIKQPSRSNAATLVDGFGSRLTPCKHVLPVPKRGSQRKVSGCFSGFSSAVFANIGNTTQSHVSDQKRDINSRADISGLCWMALARGARARAQSVSSDCCDLANNRTDESVLGAEMNGWDRPEAMTRRRAAANVADGLSAFRRMVGRSERY